VGSLTKVLACPGLRIGYVLADPELIETLERRQATWSLNGLAADALPDLLDELDLAHDVAAIRLLRDELRSTLAHHGLGARTSDANWLLVECPGLREALAPQGVLVRDCASFGLPNEVRVAVPDERGLGALERALRALDPWIERTLKQGAT
jgi:histidinol-phosphate/aromatic aminotransferase/cobyric acid decarboxylase-like protein